ncbi:Phosphatidylglycerol/phosphatidylinositol transfer protein [Lachancea thermotolerans]|uniref:Phosphatidylglycerol/phosphatidylinositol transfer protein n=1 Tax=Lachancea thermotolerans (strain ATCC 56472 / CBS 6340 / NRRL Y-8284) TaxID=559295 RepID=C5DEE3_LACTC|nr:KLTH0C08492p [Lachancea thermotolerans CBS 6340]CAR22154.1 KLTH0C08492p [Lachancea thermotolerans CBS 6340]
MTRTLQLYLAALLLALAAASPVFPAFFGLPGTRSQNKPIPGDSPLEQCDADDKQLLTIQLVNLLPNPPVRGENVTVSAAGHVKETIKEGAYVDVEVRLGYIKLLTQTYDLCEELEKNDVGGLKCPIAPGDYKIDKTVEIPQEVPPGKYTVLARAYTEDDDEITCLSGDIFFPSY